MYSLQVHSLSLPPPPFPPPPFLLSVFVFWKNTGLLAMLRKTTAMLYFILLRFVSVFIMCAC